MVSRVDIPADWCAPSRWQRRYAFLPWTLLLIGGFLLQLPAAQSEHHGVDEHAGAARGSYFAGANHTAANARFDQRTQANAPSVVTENAPPPRLETPEHPVAQTGGKEAASGYTEDPGPNETLSHDHLPDGRLDLQSTPSDAAAMLDGAETGTGSETGAAVATGSSASVGSAGGATAGSLAFVNPPQQQVEFLDIARHGTGPQGAGSLAVELDNAADGFGGGDSRAPRITGTSVRSRFPYRTGHFSPGQALQISHYFERIQELP